MKRILAKIVDVKPDEIRALWLGFVFNFMVLGSYYVIKPVRDDIGAHNGVENLWWMFTGTLLVALLNQGLPEIAGPLTWGHVAAVAVFIFGDVIWILQSKAS